MRRQQQAEASMNRQVFLGGACGTTTWRRDIAIPALESAGVTYFDPQLGVGEWTEACEAAEMKAKAEADVLLFVISGQTRGVASIAEVAYLIAARRPVALVLTDVPDGACIDRQAVTPLEKDDLNRGRIFVRTMAACHGVPVFEAVEDAVQHAIELAKTFRRGLTLSDIQAILADVSFKGHEFLIEPSEDGFHIQLRCEEEDVYTGARSIQTGRKWHVSRCARRSEIVQTAFKAVLTWQEHEAREHFRYRGAQVYGPHFNVDRLTELWRSTHGEQMVRTLADK
jgi:Nucleoside 2-deoxyribosyltransferase like